MMRNKTMRSPINLLSNERKPQRTGKSACTVLQHDANPIVGAVSGDGVLQYHSTQKSTTETLFRKIKRDRSKQNVFLFGRFQANCHVQRSSPAVVATVEMQVRGVNP